MRRRHRGRFGRGCTALAHPRHAVLVKDGVANERAPPEAPMGFRRQRSRCITRVLVRPQSAALAAPLAQVGCGAGRDTPRRERDAPSNSWPPWTNPPCTQLCSGSGVTISPYPPHRAPRERKREREGERERGREREHPRVRERPVLGTVLRATPHRIWRLKTTTYRPLHPRCAAPYPQSNRDTNCRCPISGGCERD